MCGRFGVTLSGTELAGALHAAWEGAPLREPRYNLCPSQHAPVLLRGEDGPRLTMMRWGLIPFWAKEGTSKYAMNNARSETVAEKPAFRAAFRARRCLVPMSGFYEWHAAPGGKVPHWITGTDGEVLLVAGLWEEWRGHDAEPVRTFTVLTTGANTFMSAIHDRMPVFVDGPDREVWTDPDADADALAKLLRAAPDDRLRAHPVSTRVNSPRNDEPSLIEAVLAT